MWARRRKPLWFCRFSEDSEPVFVVFFTFRVFFNFVNLLKPLGRFI